MTTTSRHTLTLTVAGANWAEVESEAANAIRAYYRIPLRGADAEPDDEVLRDADVTAVPSAVPGRFLATVTVTR